MRKRLVKTTAGAVITWHKLSTEYSFASLGYTASMSELEPLGGLSSEPKEPFKSRLHSGS